MIPSSPAITSATKPNAALSLQDQIRLTILAREVKRNSESPSSGPIPEIRNVVESPSFQDQLKSRIALRNQENSPKVVDSIISSKNTEPLSFQDQLKAKVAKRVSQQQELATATIDPIENNSTKIPPIPNGSIGGPPLLPSPPPPPPPISIGNEAKSKLAPLKIAQSNMDYLQSPAIMSEIISSPTGSLQDQLKEKLAKKAQLQAEGNSTPTNCTPRSTSLVRGENFQDQLKAKLKKRSEGVETSSVIVEKKVTTQERGEVSFQDQLKNRLKKRTENNANSPVLEVGSSWKKEVESQPIFPSLSGNQSNLYSNQKEKFTKKSFNERSRKRC
jgi:hypothetical protein